MEKSYEHRHRSTNEKLRARPTNRKDEPMQAKKVLPLALLYTADGRIKGRTRFQKLAFLADQELDTKGIDPYEFIPYDYGPFDSSLYDELEWLENQGLVSVAKSQTYGGDTRYDYRLTKKGWKSFERNLPEAEPADRSEQHLQTIYEVAKEIVDEYNDVPLSNLIDYIYTEYPRYAQNSVLY